MPDLPSGRQVDVLQVGSILGTLPNTNMPRPSLAVVPLALGAGNKLGHRQSMHSRNQRRSSHPFPVFLYLGHCSNPRFLYSGSCSSSHLIKPRICCCTIALFCTTFSSLLGFVACVADMCALMYNTRLLASYVAQIKVSLQNIGLKSELGMQSMIQYSAGMHRLECEGHVLYTSFY